MSRRQSPRVRGEWEDCKSANLFIIPLIRRIDPDFEIYHISYLWYTLVGALVTILVAVITSFLCGPNKPSEMNPMLLAPFVRRIIWGKDLKSRAQEENPKAQRSLEDANCMELS